MEPIDIVILVLAILIVGYVIGKYIYKKIKKMPTGECAYCAIKSEKTIKKIRKALKKDKKNNI